MSGTAIGITASATDASGVTPTYCFKDASNAPVTSNGTFSIDADGTIRLARALVAADRLAPLTATVFAHDGTAFSTNGRSFSVTVANVAPTQPALTSTSVSLAEGSGSGTAIGITASATDAGGVTPTYCFKDNANAPVTSNGTFSIDADGTIRLARALVAADRQAALTATVFAHDGTAFSTNGRSFSVTVTNVAPTQPALTNTAVSLAEGAGSGTAIGITASATDAGGVTPTYCFKDGANAPVTSNGTFSIDADGTIRLARALVAADRQAPLTATVFAHDGTAFSASGRGFSVTVTNVAPTQPALTNTSVSLAEGSVSGTAIGIVASATDAGGVTPTYCFKDGSNAPVTSNGTFSIDANGTIRLARALVAADRQTPLTAMVFAHDGTAFSASGRGFSVTVTNVAPTQPALTSTAVSLAEGSVSGTAIGIVASATDAGGVTPTYCFKDGANAPVTSNGTFSIDVTGTIRLARTLVAADRQAPLTATVFAHDGTAFSASGQGFSVTVTNLAPTQPVLTNTAVSLAEGSVLGTAIGVVASATDAGGVTPTYCFKNGANAPVTSNGTFSIDADGTIRLARALVAADRQAPLTATVFAHDGTAFSASGQGFIVTVTNVAPTRPVLSHGGAAALPEGSAPATALGVTATATDAGGSVLTYYFTDLAGGHLATDPTGYLTIDPASGSLVLARSLITADQAAAHTASVIAFDGEADSPAATVTLTVANLPPSTPAVTQAAITLPEGTSDTVTVLSIATATDPGGATVSYGFSDGHGGRVDTGGDGYLAIDAATGAVTLKQALLVGALGGHTATVVAFDGLALSPGTTVTLTVTNVPPSRPTLDAAALTIDEGTAPSAAVLDRATSSDISGTPVSYWFTGTGGARTATDRSGLLAIDGSGAITLARRPLAADLGAHTATIVAFDGTGPSDGIDMAFTIADVPPSVPTDADGAAGPGSVAGSVAENQSAGTQVGIRLQATDPGNATVTYRLDDDAGGAFAIDSGTGVVTTAKVLDYEATAPTHQLQITAHATEVGGSGLSSATATFTIAIGDRDDAIASVGWGTGTRSVVLVDASKPKPLLTTDWTDPDGTPAAGLAKTLVNGWTVALAMDGTNFSTLDDELIAITSVLRDGLTVVSQGSGRSWSIRRSDGDQAELATVTASGLTLTLTFAGTARSGTPLLSVAEIRSVLGRLAFTTGGDQDLSQRQPIAFTVAIAPPAHTDADGATLAGRLVLNQANQRPVVEVLRTNADGTYHVSRPGSLDLTQDDLRIDDDHYPAGYDLVVVYPPRAGTLLQVANGVEAPLDADGTTLPIAGAVAPAFTVRYKTLASSAAQTDSCVLQVVDHGVDVPGGGDPGVRLASELFVVSFTIADDGGYRPTGFPDAVRWTEDADPVRLGDAVGLGVLGLTADDDQLSGAWSLAIGSRTPVGASTDTLQELSVATGDGLTLLSREIILDGSVHIGAIDTTSGLYDGTAGRALKITLDTGITLGRLKRLLAAIAYRTLAQDVPTADTIELTMGFIQGKPDDPLPITIAIDRRGVPDAPVFVPTTLHLKVPRGATIRGASVITDVDSPQLIAPIASPTSMVPGAFATGQYDSGAHLYRHSLSWQVTLPADGASETTYTLSVQDASGNTANQSIVITALADDGDIHFISDPPLYQRLGQTRAWRLRTSSAVAPVFLLAQGSAAGDADAAALFTIDNSAGTLTVDFSTTTGLTPGQVVSCLVIANVDGGAAGIATGVLPIRMVVGDRLSGSN